MEQNKYGLLGRGGSIPMIRHRRIAVLLLGCMVLTAISVAAQDLTQRAMDNTLRGLHGVYVFVEPIKPDAEQDGHSRKQIQTDVELRLHKAGIRVLSKEELLTAPGWAGLRILVNTSTKRSGAQLYGVYVEVSLLQWVLLQRDLSMEGIPTQTWHVGGVSLVGASAIRQLREAVADYVDRFINAYLSVNRK
jgi:hypothetical protein